jgi:multicomponent K+:H+ antiporter subunit A
MSVSPANPVLVVCVPLAASLLLAVAGPRSRDGAALVALAATLAAALAVLSLGPAVFAGQVPAWSLPWLPLPGADLGFRVDGLAWLFAFLITGIGALVVLYARYYLGPEEAGGRFFASLSFFMGSMLGVVLADNLLLLAIFWELTGLASFLLIGFWQERTDARQGARVSLAVTAGGGLALLAGALLLGQMAGSLKLEVVLAAGETVRQHPAYLPALVLVLLGAFTKRPVPLPLLAAPGHGGTDTRVGLPAFGHPGEGGRVPAGPSVPGAGRHR